MLDATQKTVNKHFSKDHWLNDQENAERFIDYVTYYRRNMCQFIQEYLGINLYWYQMILIYLMNAYPAIAVVAARASAKSWVVAVYACAKAILYPKTKVVIMSATKNMSSLIVEEKIKKELIPRSRRLALEIVDIVNSQNKTEVKFGNDSSIVVVPALESGLGNRSSLLIFEEFRRIPKDIVDRIAIPFQQVRPAEYRTLPQYSEMQELDEEPTTVYISSSGASTEWIYPLCTGLVEDYYKDKSGCFVALDLAIVLKHRIKSKQQLEKAKRDADPITWFLEYENGLLRESTSNFFSYASLLECQVQKKCIYPKSPFDRAKRANPHDLPKHPDEIRILSCDFAFVNKEANDNSATTLLRLMPQKLGLRQDGDGNYASTGYKITVPYIEADPGSHVDNQALKIKRLYYDLNCDYVVLDARNGGILVYDRLAQVLYDSERDCEYPAWQCFNDDNTARRITTPGAVPVAFVITASAKLNSDIAMLMRDCINSGRLELLVGHQTAMEEVIPNIDEYKRAPDADTQVFFERPYLETQALISEMIGLEYQKSATTGDIRLFETGSAKKDRYSSLSYGVYLASLLERDLISNTSDYDAKVFIN